MTSRSPQLGERALEILAALDCSPLTARQIIHWSTTWAIPFRSLRRTFEYLQKLAELKLVRRHRYAAIAPGQPENYYTLTREGYHLLHGPDTPPPTKGAFAEIGLSRQRHSRALADAIAHTVTRAHRSGVRVSHFFRENALRLEVADESLYPDCSFSIVTPAQAVFRYFMEIDMGTERLRSDRCDDSLQKKLRFYDRFQNQVDYRFRVAIIVASNSAPRVRHILSTAADVSSNPNRTLFYATTLVGYIASHSATSPAFRDEHDRAQSLLPDLTLAKSARLPVSLQEVVALC